MKELSGIVLFIFLVYSFSIAQENDSLGTRFMEWNLSYTCDVGRNFSGGIKRGNTYMGLFLGGISLYTDRIWKGGTFTVQLMNSHGYCLSENFVGDVQIISNIENGNYTFMEEFYYHQDLSKLSLTVGLQDLNAEFCVSEYSSNLTNSSFGIHISFPLNFAIPIYPKTAIAIAGQYHFTEKLTLHASLWDGDAGSLEDDPHNMHWTISKDDGFLTVEEMEYSSMSNRNTSIKIGGLYHTNSSSDSTEENTLQNRNLSIYAIVDQTFFATETKKIGAFVRVASFPTKTDYKTAYMGAGLSIAGLFTNKPADCFSLGYTYSRYYHSVYECDIECNYNLSIGNKICLQPTLHYIINPGAQREYANAFAGFLRMTLTI
jgi:porin